MPCFPGAFNRAFNSPGSMELSETEDGTGFSDHSGENEKRGIPQKVFLFFEKFPVERYVPFGLSPEQPVFPYKRKAPQVCILDHLCYRVTVREEGSRVPESHGDIQSGLQGTLRIWKLDFCSVKKNDKVRIEGID